MKTMGVKTLCKNAKTKWRVETKHQTVGSSPNDTQPSGVVTAQRRANKVGVSVRPPGPLKLSNSVYASTPKITDGVGNDDISRSAAYFSLFSKAKLRFRECSKETPSPLFSKGNRHPPLEHKSQRVCPQKICSWTPTTMAMFVLKGT